MTSDHLTDPDDRVDRLDPVDGWNATEPAGSVAADPTVEPWPALGEPPVPATVSRRSKGDRTPSVRKARRRRRRLPPVRAGQRRFLVVASGTDDVTAVDLATGAVARLRAEGDRPSAGDFAPFDVVDATPADPADCDDLAQPEALAVAAPPTAVGSMRGRRVRRLLRTLAAPAETHLLGFPGASAPYWEFRGMRPSVALVVPARGPLLFRRRSDDTVWARFGWPRSDNWLPVEDRRAIAALWAGRRDRLSGKELAAALGFRPTYLVVTLSRPRQGHCYKVVAAFLPKP